MKREIPAKQFSNWLQNLPGFSGEVIMIENNEITTQNLIKGSKP
jgi:hypothetical protein